MCCSVNPLARRSSVRACMARKNRGCELKHEQLRVTLTTMLQLCHARLPESGALHPRTRQGRSYLVAPAVNLIEGVLNGELVPAEEIGRAMPAWNGIPIVINHPMDADGLNYVSANSPDVPTIGRLYNARTNGNRLISDVWLDVELLTQSAEGRELFWLLDQGVTVEQSLAWWRELEIAPGVFNGKSYIGVARRLMPDHLAILMNGTPGACSVNDGCGVLRTNEREESMNEETPGSVESVGNEPTALAVLQARVEALAQQVEQLTANSTRLAMPCRETTLAALNAAGYTPEELALFNDEQLQVLARKQLPADYSGRGGTSFNGVARELPMPNAWS